MRVNIRIAALAVLSLAVIVAIAPVDSSGRPAPQVLPAQDARAVPAPTLHDPAVLPGPPPRPVSAAAVRIVPPDPRSGAAL